MAIVIATARLATVADIARTMSTSIGAMRSCRTTRTSYTHGQLESRMHCSPLGRHSASYRDSAAVGGASAQTSKNEADDKITRCFAVGVLNILNIVNTGCGCWLIQQQPTYACCSQACHAKARQHILNLRMFLSTSLTTYTLQVLFSPSDAKRYNSNDYPKRLQSGYAIQRRKFTTGHKNN
jgi:hypothetical protein